MNRLVYPCWTPKIPDRLTGNGRESGRSSHLVTQWLGCSDCSPLVLVNLSELILLTEGLILLINVLLSLVNTVITYDKDLLCYLTEVVLSL